jgi:natural product precursor
MKQKRPGKKLNLNKKTIAVLENRQINAVYGGIEQLTETCQCHHPCGTGPVLSCVTAGILSICIVC